MKIIILERNFEKRMDKIVIFDNYFLNIVFFFLGIYFVRYVKYLDIYCVLYSGNRGSSVV